MSQALSCSIVVAGLWLENHFIITNKLRTMKIDERDWISLTIVRLFFTHLIHWFFFRAVSFSSFFNCREHSKEVLITQERKLKANDQKERNFARTQIAGVFLSLFLRRNVFIDLVSNKKSIVCFSEQFFQETERNSERTKWKQKKAS